MTGMDDLDRRDDDEPSGEGETATDDLERASENVLEGWPSPRLDDPPADPLSDAQDGSGGPEDASALLAEPAEEPEQPQEPEQPEQPEESQEHEAAPFDDQPRPAEVSSEHAPGALSIPPGYPVLEGEARGGRRAVGIVVSRFNGDVTGRLLDSALAELEVHGVDPASITVMPVPGAFELPIAAMALAKTRRFACIVALGCVIRGDTPHFDYVASEAASGLQLAAIETGVPVAFGVLTLDRPDQAEPRFQKGAEAVRSALEMADLFSNLRAAAAR